jgi:hypothetical protein
VGLKEGRKEGNTASERQGDVTVLWKQAGMEIEDCAVAKNASLVARDVWWIDA